MNAAPLSTFQPGMELETISVTDIRGTNLNDTDAMHGYFCFDINETLPIFAIPSNKRESKSEYRPTWHTLT